MQAFYVKRNVDMYKINLLPSLVYYINNRPSTLHREKKFLSPKYALFVQILYFLKNILS
jgi:hypothetical protein